MQGRQEKFLKELHVLLKKYSAEIIADDYLDGIARIVIGFDDVSMPDIELGQKIVATGDSNEL